MNNQRRAAIQAGVAASIVAAAGTGALAQDGFAGAVNGERTGYIISNHKWHDNPTVLWDGFLNGLQGFETFYEPVGSPFYFETPFIDSQAKFVYLHHDFPDGGPLDNGNLDVYAVQVRLALTERLGFIATQDGYSVLEAREGADEEYGWNDIAFGLKYAFVADVEEQFVFTGGIRYKLNSGDSDVLQGDAQELSPFISVAKGWDNNLKFIGNLTWRAPLSQERGNHLIQWHTNFQYDTGWGIAPLVELHGVHYLSDGDRTPLNVGGLDYTNLGSTDVAGTDVIWVGVGAGIKFDPHVELSAVFEKSLTNPNVDIFDTRVTASLTIKW